MAVSIAQTQLFILALTRILALLAPIPVLGGDVIPMQVRVGIGVMLTALLIPWNPLPAGTEGMAVIPLLFAIGNELIIGIIAGFAASITFGAIQICGEMIGFTTGFNAGRVLNPAFGESSSTLDQFFIMLSLLFFLVINGHHQFILAVQRSFEVIPLNTPITVIPYDEIIRMTADLITTGIQIALPAVGALILADITLGFLAKVAPRIQVFFLGIPFKIGLGLLSVIITISLFYPAILDLLREIGPRVLRILGA